ncbi:MAG: ATP-binding protein [Patescibacteria group bacterium]|nr:ATP-binding protein [Patescibacteria group bacterium]
MRAKLKLRHKYLIIITLVVITIAAITTFVAQNYFRSYFLETYKVNLNDYVNNIASEYFDLNSPASLSKSGNQNDYKETLKKSDQINTVTLTDGNGTVIASDNKSLLNTPLLSNTSWQSAVSGEVVFEGLSFSNDTRDVKAYLPIFSQEKSVKGIVVAEITMPEIVGSVTNFIWGITWAIIGASGIYIIISYLTVAELEKKMSEKERSVFDASKVLAEEQKMYEAIATSLAESLVVVNKDGQIVLFNNEAERVTGNKAEDIEYRSYKKIINFFDEKGRKQKRDLIGESLKKGKVIKTSSKDGFYIKNAQKNLIPVSVNIAPIAAGDSFIKGVAITIEDISYEKELQKVKDEFVYVVAHELGNPIFALDGYLSLLEGKNKKYDSESKKMLTDARKINAELSNLVNDLLEVARNETGRLTFEIEKINLERIAKEVVKNESFKAKKKKIKLSLKPTRAPLAIGNEAKIKEVVTNLVNNAIKYNQAGGKVEIAITEQKGYISLSVKDNGFGMSKEEKEHLFEKFYRVKSKETQEITGTGLGLFISKQIVEKCGGRIWAETEKGKGSTFTFELKKAK